MRFNLLITIIIFILLSCGETNTPQKENEIIDELLSLPDTVLRSTNLKNNQFKFDNSALNLEIPLLNKLNGNWIAFNGKLSFHNTILNMNDKVVFDNSPSSIMTGWGLVKYNNSVRFYITNSTYHQYEYYPTKKGDLTLIKFNYRNENLSMKKDIEIQEEFLKLVWNNENEIQLSLKNQFIGLKRDTL